MIHTVGSSAPVNCFSWFSNVFTVLSFSSSCVWSRSEGVFTYCRWCFWKSMDVISRVSDVVSSVSDVLNRVSDVITRVNAVVSMTWCCKQVSDVSRMNAVITRVSDVSRMNAVVTRVSDVSKACRMSDVVCRQWCNQGEWCCNLGGWCKQWVM